MCKFFSYSSSRLIGIYAFTLGGKVMRVFLTAMVALSLAAFGVNAQEPAAGEQAEETAMPAVEETAEPMAMAEESGSGFFDGTLIDLWVESPVADPTGLVSRDQLDVEPTSYLLLRPYRKLGAGKFHLAMTFITGNPNDLPNIDQTHQTFKMDDPYLMYSGRIATLGAMDLGGYLRYYIPVSMGSRGADRASYLRGLLSGRVPSGIDGIKLGLSAELRHYAYHSDASVTGVDTRDQLRTTLYGSISGAVGPFSFYTWHGVRFKKRQDTGFSGELHAYNESLLLAKIGNSKYSAGVGLLEYRPLGDTADTDSAGNEREGQNFLYNPRYTNYVLNLTGTF